jgi:8-oxo-dGTP pyrophosphatase MutT (NUDIX family)
MMRQRVAVIIFDGANILLLYRQKQGRSYYVIPGGGVELGETLEEAAIRETQEETGLEVRLGNKLWTHLWGEQLEHYFLATQFSGIPHLGGPEQMRQVAEDLYRLVWIPLALLPDIPLVPETVKAMIMATFNAPVVKNCEL